MISPSPRLISSGALIFDSKGQFLIVNPSYKETWEIPGGIVESGESPLEACEREIMEEIGLSLQVKSLLSVVHRPATDGQVDKLQFIFDGGVLAEKKQEGITPDMEEIIEYRFVTLSEAANYLNEVIFSRVKHALENRSVDVNTFADFNEINVNETK